MNLPLKPVTYAGTEPSSSGLTFGGSASRRAEQSDAAPPPRSPILSRTGARFAMALGLGLAFFALAWLGIMMTREVGRIAAIWLANGVAVAVILRSPRRFTPWLAGGVLAGNLAANLAHADPLARAAALSVANLVEIGIAVALMRPRFGPKSAFDNGPVIGRFMAAAFVGATAAGLFAASVLAWFEGGQFSSLFLNWVTADILGLLIVGTLLLSLPPELGDWMRPSVAPPLSIQVERVLFVLSIIGATLLLFLQNQAPLLFLIGPLLVLSAFRLSLSLASFAILTASAVAVGATLMGYGPVARYANDPVTQSYALQSLIASMIALVLPVRALIVERNRLGVAYARSERKFMRIAEASTAGLLHLDLHGEVTWANHRWTEMTGERFDQDVAGRWMYAVAEEERRALASMWTEVRATLEPTTVEYAASLIAREREDCHWVALSIHPERGPDGRLSGFVVRLEDITHRRIAEEALAESERLYRLVTENVSDIVIRLGLDGSMLYVSSAVRRILGFEPEQLLGRPLRELIHGEDWPAFKSAFADLVTLERERPEVRYRHRCADGSFRWVEGKFRPVFDKANGEPTEFVASIRDISRRHRTELVIAESATKLRESNRLVSLAEDLAKVGHWRIDLAEKGFDYSAQVNAIIGVSRRDALSARGALRLVSPKDRGTLLATLARARRAERACECEVRLLTPNGEERHLRIVIQADREATGQLKGLFGVVRDVSVETRSREELVNARDRAHAAAQAKAHFLATMSHEIRTPMTGVKGMIDLLMHHPDEEERTRYLDMLKTSADLLMSVLDDILDFSKIDSGQVSLERRDFMLDRLIEESAALFERRAAEKGIALRIEQQGEVPVRGDAMRLRQVLANLLSNAIKFTDEGEIVVRLEAEEQGVETKIRIEVEDDGIGIDEKMQAHLFDPFVQADTSTSRRFGGTGLGLAICRRLIDAMGGTIGIDSKPGEGTTSWISLTLPTGVGVAACDEVFSDDASSRPRKDIAPLSILVAEDNPVNQMLIGAMLRAEGHKVTTVENGRLAVEAAAEAYDAIIMDMQMPEMDGLAATRAIRASGGPCAAIPILALTADASPERRRFYDGAGLSAFLTKPIDQEVLIDQLRSIAGLGALPVSQRFDEQDDREAGTEEEAEQLPALMDEAQLAALAMAMGKKRLAEMFTLLDVELEERPAAIQEAVRTGNVEAVQRLAHSLKGAAGSAGALAVAHLAAKFEGDDAPDPEIAALGGTPIGRAANG